MIIPTTWSVFNIGFYILFGLFSVSLGIMDYYELLPLKYSKFGTEKGVPSRIGMIILYFLPVLLSVLLAVPYLGKATAVQWVVFGAIVLHFGKRTLESMFLHKYSGKIQPLTFVIIVFAYAQIAGMISWLNSTALDKMDGLFYLGIGCVIVGEIGTLYHHKLLADLRSKNDGEYHIPKGGWFERATCPHYFFELLAWLGITLVSRHLFTMLAFIAMLGNLTARSIKTRQWYRKRFPEYPEKRKYMIPFVF